MQLIENGLADVLGSDITMKRKNITKSLLMFIIGAGIIVASSSTEGYIHSTMIFAGGLIALVGILMILSSFINKEYYYIPEKARLQKKAEFFELNDESTVKKIVEEGRFDEIKSLKKATTPTLQVIMYSTAKGKIVAAQVQKYIPYAYHPMTDIVVYK